MLRSSDLHKLEIARHLVFGEVACQCMNCRGLVGFAHMKLLIGWERIRERFGSPIRVVSGYRCPFNNKAVGGSRRSQHMKGKALDLYVPGVDYLCNDWLRELIAAGFTGIGRCTNRLHVDVRSTPKCWKYIGNERIDNDSEAMAIFREIKGQ